MITDIMAIFVNELERLEEIAKMGQEDIVIIPNTTIVISTSPFKIAVSWHDIPKNEFVEKLLNDRHYVSGRNDRKIKGIRQFKKEFSNGG